MFNKNRLNNASAGYTLIELVVVFAIIAVVTGLVSYRMSGGTYWREEGYLRKISELLPLIYQQAINDQTFYRVEFSLPDGRYRVGAFKEDSGIVSSSATQTTSGSSARYAGNLSLEMADFLSPTLGDASLMIPPPAFPSLFDYTAPPPGTELYAATTFQGDMESDQVAILFSPKGLAEFVALHFRLSSGREATIVLNPFTGESELFHERRNFSVEDFSGGAL